MPKSDDLPMQWGPTPKPAGKGIEEGKDEFTHDSWNTIPLGLNFNAYSVEGFLGRTSDHRRWPNAFVLRSSATVDPNMCEPPIREEEAGDPPVQFGGRGARRSPTLTILSYELSFGKARVNARDGPRRVSCHPSYLRPILKVLLGYNQ